MPVVHTVVGKEDMSDEEIVDNMLVVYESVRETLPQKKQNIKNIYLKMTMGTPVKIGELEWLHIVELGKKQKKMN